MLDEGDGALNIGEWNFLSVVWVKGFVFIDDAVCGIFGDGFRGD